jgi:hypothetical protein
MSTDAFTYVLFGFLGTLLVGFPLGALGFSRWTGARDREFMASVPLEDLWAATGLTPEERAHSTLLVLSHNFFGGRWQVRQDGKDVGDFDCWQMGQAQFRCDFFKSSFWVGASSHVLRSGEYNRNVHFHDGGWVKFSHYVPSQTFSIYEGADTYEFSFSGNRAGIRFNGKPAGVALRLPVNLRVVAIKTDVPEHIKALICSVLSSS